MLNHFSFKLLILVQMSFVAVAVQKLCNILLLVPSEHKSVDLNQRGLTGILDEMYAYQVEDLVGFI